MSIETATLTVDLTQTATLTADLAVDVDILLGAPETETATLTVDLTQALIPSLDSVQVLIPTIIGGGLVED